MNTRKIQQIFAGIAGAAAALVLTQWVPNVLAGIDGSDATEEVPRVIPYEGYAQRDGLPYDGELAMRFTLYDEPIEGEGAVVWTETWDEGTARVSVDDGDFSVLLGLYANINSAIIAADRLFLGIEVKADAADPWSPLTGRQRFAPAAYGLWAANAADLDVMNTLDAAGGMDVAGDVTIEGDVTLSGAGDRVTLGIAANGSGKSGDHGIEFGDASSRKSITYQSGSDRLAFVRETASSDPAETVMTWTRSGNLTANGAASVGGPLTTGGDVTLPGSGDLVLGADTSPDAITGAVDEPWLLLGEGSEQAPRSIYLGDDTTSDGLAIAYFPKYDDLHFQAGESGGGVDGDAASRRFISFDLDNRDTYTWNNFWVGGNLIVTDIDKNYDPDSCLEDDSADKVFLRDSNCWEGDLAVIVRDKDNQVGLCACFNASSTTQEKDGKKGWHCFM